MMLFNILTNSDIRSTTMMTDQIISHFSNQVEEYDGLMAKIVPRYKKQHEIINELLPENTEKQLRVLDLGCGTGALSEIILKKFPRARVVGFELTPEMLQSVDKKLSAYKDRFKLKLGDIRFDPIGQNYDIVLAGLSLQHLTWGERKNFYRQVYNGLNPNGSFILNDIIIDEDWQTRKVQYKDWMKFIAANGEDPDFWLDRHLSQDYPVTPADHFQWLKEAGFSKTDCYWRFQNFVITIATK